MPNPYSVELRRRVVHAYQSGRDTFESVAQRFAIGLATAKRWVRLKETSGDLAPRRRRGGTPSEIRIEEVEAIIAELRDPTARELTVRFNQKRRGGARVHVSSMKRALRRFGYVVKKNADGRWRVCAPMS